MISNELAWQNDVVLALVQALIGAIPPHVDAISIKTNLADRSVDIFFALRNESPDDADLIEEIETDLEALTDGQVLVSSHVWVGDDWIDSWPSRQCRLVYAAKRRYNTEPE